MIGVAFLVAAVATFDAGFVPDHKFSVFDARTPYQYFAPAAVDEIEAVAVQPYDKKMLFPKNISPFDTAATDQINGCQSLLVSIAKLWVAFKLEAHPVPAQRVGLHGSITHDRTELKFSVIKLMHIMLGHINPYQLSVDDEVQIKFPSHVHRGRRPGVRNGRNDLDGIAPQQYLRFADEDVGADLRLANFARVTSHLPSSVEGPLNPEHGEKTENYGEYACESHNGLCRCIVQNQVQFRQKIPLSAWIKAAVINLIAVAISWILFKIDYKMTKRKYPGAYDR